MEIRGNNIDRSISMLLRIITASKIVIKNDIIEKQTSVIVYSYISFFNKNYHIVWHMWGQVVYPTLPSNEKHLKKK